jgi:3',5'-cyclic AMP phosphodiesterase CpdA
MPSDPGATSPPHTTADDGLDFVLIQLGDLHVGADWVNADPGQTLAATVDEIRRLPLAVHAVLAAGDLAEHGADGEYAAVRAELDRLDAPIYPVVGNRDERGALCRHFGLETRGDAPVHYAAELGRLRLVVLDTTIPGSDAGHLERNALLWLERELDEHPDSPTLLAMHHPPLLTGSAAWDRIALSVEAQTALAGVLQHHPQVRRIFGAHLHRPLVTQFAGRPLVVAPSTYVQFPIDPHALELAPTDEAPAYVVHVIATDARIISSIQTVPRPTGER